MRNGEGRQLRNGDSSDAGEAALIAPPYRRLRRVACVNEEHGPPSAKLALREYGSLASAAVVGADSHSRRARKRVLSEEGDDEDACAMVVVANGDREAPGVMAADDFVAPAVTNCDSETGGATMAEACAARVVARGKPEATHATVAEVCAVALMACGKPEPTRAAVVDNCVVAPVGRSDIGSALAGRGRRRLKRIFNDDDASGGCTRPSFEPCPTGGQASGAEQHVDAARGVAEHFRAPCVDADTAERRSDLKQDELHASAEALAIEVDADFALALQLQDQEKDAELIAVRRRDAEAHESLDCGICFESRRLESIYFVPCPGEHFFCAECMYRHVRTEVLERGRRPLCPLSRVVVAGASVGAGSGGGSQSSTSAPQGCGYALSQSDVEDALRMAVDSLDRQSEARRIVDVLGALELPAVAAEGGCVRCPGCGGWLEPQRSGGKHAVCPSCGCSFCSGCEQRPYHYRGTCEDQLLMRERFAWWRLEGRAEYLRSSADEAEVYYEQWRHYNEQREWHRQQVADAARRCDELRRDERWKALHCRMCPKCGRPIQRMRGCDQMVCGTNAHGGNVQQGCGHVFNWSKAPKYAPQEEPKLQPALSELKAAIAAARPVRRRKASLDATWPGPDGALLTCDACRGVVRGPRFDCVHCPSFTCCVHCEAAASAGACHNHPEADHVFDLVLEPPEAAATAGWEPPPQNQSASPPSTAVVAVVEDEVETETGLKADTKAEIELGATERPQKEAGRKTELCPL